MSTVYHEPLTAGAAANVSAINDIAADLDAAIVAVDSKLSGGTPITGVDINSGTIDGITAFGVAVGSRASLASTPASVTGTYTGTSSEIASLLGLTFTDNRNVANLSNQVFRFTYVRDAAATAEPTAFDAGIAVVSVFEADQTAPFQALSLSGPVVSSGMTVAAAVGLSISDAGGAGAITTQYGIQIADLSKGGTNYAIYTGAGIVRIGGDLRHDGTNLGVYGATPAAKGAVTGSRGGNAALANLLTYLATRGFLTDSTS